MASSKYLHRSINLSCIIWVTTELCLERAEVAPGVCWAGPSKFLGCVQVSTMLHCLCLLQSWLSILAEPTEKLTAQPPTAWGNTCHAQFGKQRQADSTCKGWVAGGSEGLVCSPAVCAICGLQAREPLAKAESQRETGENRQRVFRSKLQAGAEPSIYIFSFFFFFCNVILSLCCP